MADERGGGSRQQGGLQRRMASAGVGRSPPGGRGLPHGRVPAAGGGGYERGGLAAAREGWPPRGGRPPAKGGRRTGRVAAVRNVAARGVLQQEGRRPPPRHAAAAEGGWPPRGGGCRRKGVGRVPRGWRARRERGNCRAGGLPPRAKWPLEDGSQRREAAAGDGWPPQGGGSPLAEGRRSRTWVALAAAASRSGR